MMTDAGEGCDDGDESYDVDGIDDSYGNDDSDGNDYGDGNDTLFEAFLIQKILHFFTNFYLNHGTFKN